MIRLLINGIHGQMGRALCKAAEESDSFTVSGGVDRVVDAAFPYPIFPDYPSVNVPYDVIIDFSVPAALEEELRFASANGKPLVVGTTGLTERHVRMMKNASVRIPVFASGNMSLGVNLQMGLVRDAAAALGPSFDIEIIERHHRTKKDAPSGTALMLADAISGCSPEEYEYVYGRHEKDRRRSSHEIGFHSVRGGTLVGEHEVSFSGKDEVVSVTHQAFSKQVFAQGALRAASYIADKPSGFYNMENIVTEHNVVSLVTALPDQAVIHLGSAENTPGLVRNVFRSVSDQGIFVDMISCSAPDGEPVSLAFSVPDNYLSEALRAVNRVKGVTGVHSESDLVKVTVEGSGMALRKGIAAQVLSALHAAGIHPSIITTSETKIEFCVASALADTAVRTVEKEFTLG